MSDRRQVAVARPTLIVVTGPAGAGKTTLAHRLAAEIGCPAVSRDEIKEGMAFGDAGFAPDVGDRLTKRTLPVFFRTLALLLESGVTTVAEAAFQHRVWAPNLAPLAELASIRVIRCRTAPTVARRRVLHRAADRSVHADRSVLDDPAYYDRYAWLDLDATSGRIDTTDVDTTDVDTTEVDATDVDTTDVDTIDVDTTDGYAPGIAELAAWVEGGPALSGRSTRPGSGDR